MSVDLEERDRTGAQYSDDFANDLRQRTGITPEEEQAMDDRASSDQPDTPNGINRGGFAPSLLNDKETSSKPNSSKSPTEANERSALGIGEQNSPTKDTIGKGFTGPINNPRVAMAKKLLNSKAAYGAGATTGIAAILIAGFMSFAQMRIVSFVENIQKRAFAAMEESADEMAEHIFSRYITHHVLPGMIANRCTTTLRDKSCANVRKGTGTMDQIMYTLSQHNAEGKMAKAGSTEIISEGEGANTRFYIRFEGIEQRMDITRFRNFNGNMFAELSNNPATRAQIRALTIENLRKVTNYPKMMYYFKVGPYLERQHGIRRCVFFCKPADKIDNLIQTRPRPKLGLALIAQRVLRQYSASLELFVGCAADNFGCADKGTADPDENGQRLTRLQKERKERLNAIRAELGVEKFDKITTDLNDIKKDGLSMWAAKKVVGPVAAKFIGQWVPFYNIINDAAMLSEVTQKAGPALTHIDTVLKKDAMISTFMLYATVSSEIKNGQVGTQRNGELAATLNSNPNGDQGTASAESATVYNVLFGGNTYKTSGATSTGEVCYDGTALNPTKQTVCPEVQFGPRPYIQAMTKAGKAYVDYLAPMSPAAIAVWDKAHSVVGWIFTHISPVGVGLKHIPWDKLPDELIQKVVEIAEAPLLHLLRTHVLTPNVSEDPEKQSGSQNAALAIGGGVVAANEAAHYSMGGRVLSEQELSQVLKNRQTQEDFEFSRKSFAQRMFDTSDSRSLVATLSLKLPYSRSGQVASMSGLFSPLNGLFGSFSRIFSAQRVRADSSSTVTDIYNVTPYALGPDDPIIPKVVNDATYETGNNEYGVPCGGEYNKKWAEDAIYDDETGEFHNYTANGCKVLSFAKGIMVGSLDTSMLEPEDLDGGDSSIPTVIDGNTSDYFKPSRGMKCPDGSTSKPETGYTKGKPVEIGVCEVYNAVVNVRIAANYKALIDSAKKDGIGLSSSSSFRTMAKQRELWNGRGGVPVARPGYSNHQMGLAIDFAYKGQTICWTLPSARCHGNAGFDWLKKNAGKFDLKNLSSESWHWSVNGG